MAARPRTILVGYDGSESAQRALDTAADMAGYGSRLTVVTVRNGDVGEGVAAAARRHLLDRHVAAGYLEPVGEAAETLIETATELGADLLVVGRREQNTARRLVLGSVSSKVVRRATCDVLVVR
jgi:nucleotide-binding universal stress UspA family protein